MAVNGFGAITWPHIWETVLKNEDQKGVIEWHTEKHVWQSGGGTEASLTGGVSVRVDSGEFASAEMQTM